MRICLSVGDAESTQARMNALDAEIDARLRVLETKGRKNVGGRAGAGREPPHPILVTLGEDGQSRLMCGMEREGPSLRHAVLPPL